MQAPVFPIFSFNNVPTGCKRAPGSAAGMQQCQNDWQAWHILQGAQSRRSGRKQEKLREKSGKLRCRCGFARTQAFQRGCLDMFTKRDTETEPHTHRDTRTGCLYHSFSQALSVSGLQKSFGPWPSSCTRACLYRARARSTVEHGCYSGSGMDALYGTY